MTKPVTQKRLHKAVESWVQYRDALLLKRNTLLEVVKESGIVLPRRIKDSQSLFSKPAKDTMEQIHRFELNINGINTFGDFKQLLSEHRKYVDQVIKKKEKLKEIQLFHNISGLTREYLQIGSSQVECWQPTSSLWLTDDDLIKLREDRVNIFELWREGVQSAQLQVFELSQDLVWALTDLTKVERSVLLADYAIVHEEVSYFNSKKAVEIASNFHYPGFSMEAILADLTISMPTEIVELTQLSPVPSRGLNKRHIIYLHVGEGKEMEPLNVTSIFCASLTA